MVAQEADRAGQAASCCVDDEIDGAAIAGCTFVVEEPRISGNDTNFWRSVSFRVPCCGRIPLLSPVDVRREALPRPVGDLNCSHCASATCWRHALQAGLRTDRRHNRAGRCIARSDRE